MNVFIDTNYFVRFIENDNERHREIVEKLFYKAMDGQIILQSSLAVCFEIYWLMKSHYGRRKEALQEILQNVIDMNFVKWENQELLKLAIGNMSKHNFDLEDTYNLEYAKKNKIENLASFDEKLQKLWKK